MFYTYVYMKYFWTIAVLLAVSGSLPSLQAAEKQYGPGRIVGIEKKARERVLYYLVNTPVTQDDPYYELSLQQSNWVYLAEYTPRHACPRTGSQALKSRLSLRTSATRGSECREDLNCS